MKNSKCGVILLIVFFFLLGGSVQAQVIFTKIIVDNDFLINSQPFDLKIADLNNDDEVDIIVSSPDPLSGENSVFLWYQNDGNEIFSKNVIDTVIAGGGTFDVADINSDLDKDIILAASGQISVYDNDGYGNFDKSIIDVFTLPKVPFIIDFDMDSANDIVLLSHDGIFWEKNLGNLNFTRDTVDVVTINDLALFVADIDGDSEQDLVTYVYVDSLDEDMLVWYKNDGAENFVRITVDTTTQNVYSIIVDDLDDDGNKDIILIDLRNDGDFIQWYQNDGSENFTKNVISTDFNRSPWSLAIADIDNDGDKDVLTTGGNGAVGEVVYYENDGAENFIKRIIDDTPGNRQRLAVIDADNDTDLDLFVTNNYPFEVIYYRNDSIMTGVKQNLISRVSKEYNLHQNYPNPFNPVTTIEFYLPKSSEVILKIFNTLGEDVATLVSEQLNAGSYSYNWDASNLPSGVYLYCLEAEGFVEIKKMILLR